MNINDLTLKQVDASLAQVLVPLRPQIGWIQTIRTTLGMTAQQLAQRMGISQATVSNLEKSEAVNTITLQSLQRAAQALDCEVVYALVPRQPLANMVSDKATQLAIASVHRVRHTMSLEAQSTPNETAQVQIKARKEALLAGRWSKLWN
jgi:predicted DNA-binding mobile mystery protein A